MDNYFTTFPPLVVAETWVVAVVSVAIIGCFIFLVVLLVLSHRAKSANPKLYTNVRRKIFYAEPQDQSSETKVTSSTTNVSNQSVVPVVLNSMVPYAPVAVVPPPPPRPRPLIFERVRRVFVPTPVPVPTPLNYYPGRMFANNVPRRYYPYRPII